jgi:iron complex outermembrane receptor protein
MARGTDRRAAFTWAARLHATTRVGIAAGALIVGPPAMAHADAAHFDIPPQPLPSALRVFASQAHMELLYVHSEVARAKGNPVQGDLEKQDALAQLLRNTGLEVIYGSGTSATIRTVRAAVSTRGTPGDASSEGTSRRQALPATAPSGGDSTLDSGQLQEVIVTSQKRKERLQDVPVPVTAVTAHELSDSNEFRLQDYYTQVPGLQLTPNQLGGTSTIAIRGITTGDFSNPTVGITVDDMPFGSSTVLGGGFLVPDLDPSDLARIEVLRGPQGTLYGASSVGGLIKYVTNDPSTDKLAGRLQAGLSNVSASSEAGYNVSGALNVPLSDTLAVRGSAFTRRDPGYIDNIQAGDRDTNRTQVKGGHLSALWQPSETFSLKASALIQDNRLYGSPYVALAPGVGDLEQRFLPGMGETFRKFQVYSAIAGLKLGSAQLTSITSYSKTRLTDSYDYTRAIGDSGEVMEEVFGTRNTKNTDVTTTSKLTQELRLEMPLGPRVDWLLGGFYTRERTPWLEYWFATDDAGAETGTFAVFDFWSKYRDLAAFTDFTFHVTDRFDIQVGGRESRIRQIFGETDSGPFAEIIEGAPILTYPVTTVNESAFTYLLTPQFKVSKDFMVYARLASGYRPGGINAQGALVGLSPTFTPDKTRNYEIGAKASVLDNLLYVEGSVYRIDWKDIQLQQTTPLGLTIFGNGSAAKSEGVELSLQSASLNGFRTGGWVSWNRARLTEALPDNSIVVGAAGERLPYSARFSANASIDYEFPVGGLRGSVGADVSYVGRRLGTFVGDGFERQDFPSYTKEDVRAGLKTDDWSFDLYVNNLANKRGILGGGRGTLNDEAFTLIQPRTAGLTVAKSF